MASDSQAALEEFMDQIPEEELEAALELEDYSTGSDISEAGQVYYLMQKLGSSLCVHVNCFMLEP